MKSLVSVGVSFNGGIPTLQIEKWQEESPRAEKSANDRQLIRPMIENFFQVGWRHLHMCWTKATGW